MDTFFSRVFVHTGQYLDTFFFKSYHKNSHNQVVRGHRTGPSHSGAEEYPREKHKHPKVVDAYITADAMHASTRNI